MEFDVITLQEILGRDAQFVNIHGDSRWSLLNIAHLNQFDRLESRDGVLYFCVYEDNPDLSGWYVRPFDRTDNISQVTQDKRVTLLVDSRCPKEKISDLKYIRVENIFDAINKIRMYILSNVRPRVIGVTGSVGKTTCVSLIEEVLGRGFICGRIFSKRLTPLTLSSWLANFLEPQHQILVLEYSMYRESHIADLLDILPADFGAFLNVKRMHLGVKGIRGLEDIVRGKRALVDRSKVAVINIDDPLVATLKRPGDFSFSLTDPSADLHICSDGGEAVMRLNISDQEIRFTPYLNTRLFYYQTAAAGLLGTLLNVSPDSIKEALDRFKPKENRIGWISIFGQNVLFDGDVTMSGRLSSLSEHYYGTSLLLVHSFYFGDEDVWVQVDDFNRLFQTFSEVRVLDTGENREVVCRYDFRVSFTKKEDFFYDLNRFGFTVFHFGIYFRKHPDMVFLNNFLTECGAQ